MLGRFGEIRRNNRRYKQIAWTLLFSLFPSPKFEGGEMSKPERNKCCYAPMEGKLRYNRSQN